MKRFLFILVLIIVVGLLGTGCSEITTAEEKPKDVFEHEVYEVNSDGTFSFTEPVRLCVNEDFAVFIGTETDYATHYIDLIFFNFTNSKKEIYQEEIVLKNFKGEMFGTGDYKPIIIPPTGSKRFSRSIEDHNISMDVGIDRPYFTGIVYNSDDNSDFFASYLGEEEDTEASISAREALDKIRKLQEN